MFLLGIRLLVVSMTHKEQSTTNLKPQQLAKEELGQEKYDMVGLEMAIQLFGGQAKK